MIDGEQTLLWRRFPVAAQRLRAALLDAAFPQVLEVDARIEPSAEDRWTVRIDVLATGEVIAEPFTGTELRAYRGRWDEWVEALAARLTGADQRAPGR